MDQDSAVDLQVQAQEGRRPATSAEPERSAVPFASVARLAAGAGNRSFSRFVARAQEGDGILPGGVVHPDVEAAIAAASGGGRALDRGVAADAGSQLGDSFADVRVHADETAAALSRAVAARAFTVGRDIFFGDGEYRPDTSAGRELLTHELAHVVQQRDAPATGPLLVSHPGDPLEQEAESVARGFG